jgi:hypothetical protein
LLFVENVKHTRERRVVRLYDVPDGPRPIRENRDDKAGILVTTPLPHSVSDFQFRHHAPRIARDIGTARAHIKSGGFQTETLPTFRALHAAYVIANGYRSSVTRVLAKEMGDVVTELGRAAESHRSFAELCETAERRLLDVAMSAA